MQCGRVESKKKDEISKGGMRGVNTYVQIRATHFFESRHHLYAFWSTFDRIQG